MAGVIAPGDNTGHREVGGLAQGCPGAWALIQTYLPEMECLMFAVFCLILSDVLQTHKAHAMVYIYVGE